MSITKSNHIILIVSGITLHSIWFPSAAVKSHRHFVHLRSVQIEVLHYLSSLQILRLIYCLMIYYSIN